MSGISPTGAGTFARLQPASEAQDVSAFRGEDRTVAAPRRGADRVEVSDVSRLIARLNELPSVRADLVDRVRSEINAGTYDTQDRFDLALDALIDDLGEV